MDLQKIAHVVRGLSADAVQAANSGHPGAPLGCAEIGSVLFFDVLNHNPANSNWANRDRFVLSGGHGSMLLYSLLHLSGYDVTLADLKNFRQLGSNTPGHPEYGDTDGVETTTGPLGQGIGNAVGMAIGEQMAAARFNRPGYDIIDHYTYVLAGDGDLMEGVSAEASSLAGHLKLGKLIMVYDSNEITIEGSTDLTFTESVKDRYKAYGWHVTEVDGHNLTDLRQAFAAAKKITDKPSLIVAKTAIAKGAPTKEGTAASHGAPLGEEEIAEMKRNIGLPADKQFYVPKEMKEATARLQEKGRQKEEEWKETFAKWAEEYSDLAKTFQAWWKNEMPAEIEEALTMFDQGANLSTRVASGRVLNALAPKVKNLVGGSADLAPSNMTYLEGQGDITPDNFGGRNFNFGVREHGMAAVLNGLSLYGFFRVYGATFLVFTDYMRASMRLAALMKQPVVYVLTHDSAYVGEDGPTHQPVEHTESLRLIPNLTVYRPADAEETAHAWVQALKRNDGPTALVLSRQNLPMNEKPEGWDFAKGGYIIRREKEELAIVLVASGSEVSLACEAAERIEKPGLGVRVVSVPCREVFLEQKPAYRNEVIPKDVPALAVELGVGTGWYALKPQGEMYVYDLNRFGASGPGPEVAEHLGFSAKALQDEILKILG